MREKDLKLILGMGLDQDPIHFLRVGSGSGFSQESYPGHLQPDLQRGFKVCQRNDVTSLLINFPLLNKCILV